MGSQLVLHMPSALEEVPALRNLSIITIYGHMFYCRHRCLPSTLEEVPALGGFGFDGMVNVLYEGSRELLEPSCSVVTLEAGSTAPVI